MKDSSESSASYLPQRNSNKYNKHNSAIWWRVHLVGGA